MRNIDRTRYNAQPARFGLYSPSNLFLLSTQSVRIIYDTIPWYLRGAFDGLVISGLSYYGALKALSSFERQEMIPEIGQKSGPEVKKIILDKVKLNDMPPGKRKYAMMAYKAPRKSYAFNPNYAGKAAYSTKVGSKYDKKFSTSVVQKIEKNGTVFDPQVVYIGIGANYENMILNVCRTIVVALFEVSGYKITNIDNIVDGSYSLETKYYANIASGTLISFSTSFTANSTINSMATQLKASFVSQFGQTSHVINEFRLKQLPGDAGNQITASQITASNFRIQYALSQALLVQNRTLGQDAGATDEDYSALNVTNNPIKGHVFNKKGNVILPLTRENVTDASFAPFATWDDGYPEVFAYKGADQWVKSPVTVGNTFESCSVDSSFLLQPGQMKKLSQSIIFKKPVNWFITTFFAILSTDSTTIERKPGHTKVVAFDKLLATSGEPELTVGYELNQTVRMGYHIKKNKKKLPIYS